MIRYNGSKELDRDTTLMLQVKRGDEMAFTELLEKYKQPVIKLLSRTLGDPTEAEDLAQVVFVKVYISAGRFQFSAKFSTWLYTIARNLCFNEIRRRSRHPLESFDDQRAESEDYPHWRQYEDRHQGVAHEALLQQELRQKIEEALASLPADQRTAIVLYQEGDLSYNQIAAALGITLAATKSLIHRGRKTLKQKLIPYVRTGAWHGSRSPRLDTDNKEISHRFRTSLDYNCIRAVKAPRMQWMPKPNAVREEAIA